MRLFSCAILLVIASLLAHGQQRPSTLDLRQLIRETIENNPEVLASLHQIDIANAKMGQAGTLDDPELTYMREEMPGFRWSQSEMEKIGLMQMFRFPSKLSKEAEIAEINVDYSLHEHHEKELEVVARLKYAYYELWFFQQSILLNRENSRLLQQFVTIAKTKFGVGEASLQDVLKANVELAKLENQGITLQQQAEGAKAMLIAILNRHPNDTLGVAVLPDSLVLNPSLDTLRQVALRSRPMLLNDSLAVEEGRAMLSLSKREYLPDLKVGLEYVTAPIGDFRGWNILAGITLPFAPWTLGKAASRVEQATATISKTSATLNASRNMVLSNVRDLYLKSQSARRQLDAYRTMILPQAQQSLKASLTAYQNGQADFLTLVDAYRTFVELSMESLMVRMQFEQSVSELERQVGVVDVASISDERKKQ